MVPAVVGASGFSPKTPTALYAALLCRARIAVSALPGDDRLREILRQLR